MNKPATAPAKVPWIIQFQRKDLLTACWGGEKEANLLYHFLNKASWEVKNNHLESCKVIPFKEEHDEILELVPMAEGTLIKYLKRFNLAGYVSSGRYGSTFTVNVEAIQAAFTNPPAKPLSAPRGRPKGFKVSRINKTKKSETLEENSETSIINAEKSGVSRINEHEEVSRLNEKVLSLELEVLSLKEKVLNLELLVLSLKLSETRESAPEEAGEAKVSLQNDLEMIQNDLEKESTYSDISETATVGADAPARADDEIPYLPNFMADQSKIHIAPDEEQPTSEEKLDETEVAGSDGYQKPGEAEQDVLIERPAVPEMPPTSARWCAETMVQIVEAKLKRYYRQQARTKELNAASRILKGDRELTRERFILAYDERDDKWWHDHKGPLHVHHMAEKDRVHEMLDRIDMHETEKASQPSQQNNSQPQQRGRAGSPNVDGASARLPEDISQRNKDRLKEKYDAIMAAQAAKAAAQMQAAQVII